MEFLIFWVLFAIIGAVIMDNKGRSGFAGALLGLLLGPIGIIIALVLSRNTDKLDEDAIIDGTGRRCPYCAEVVKVQAIVCKHCGRDLAPRD